MSTFAKNVKKAFDEEKRAYDGIQSYGAATAYNQHRDQWLNQASKSGIYTALDTRTKEQREADEYYAGLERSQQRAEQQTTADAKVRGSLWDIISNAAAMQNSQYLPVDQQLNLAHRQAKATNDFTTGLKESKEAAKAIEWAGRQKMVDEYRQLNSKAYRARQLHDIDADELTHRASELRAEIQRRDIIAGNGDRSLYAGERMTDAVSSMLKGVGSSLTAFGADVGQAIGKAFVNQQLLSENQFLLDQMLGEDTMARYNQVNAAMNSEEGQRVWNEMYSVADSLGEGAARDLARAKNGLDAIGRAGIDIGVNALQMGFDAGVTALSMGTIPALASMFVRVAGESMREARLEGVPLERRLAYGFTKGTIEVVTEKMFDGVAKLYGAGAFDDIVEAAIRRAASTDAGKTMLRILAGASGEAIEEFVSGWLDPYTEAIKTGKIGKRDWEEILYSAFIGFTIGFLGSGTTMINGDNAKANAELNARTAMYEQMGQQPGFSQEMRDQRILENLRSNPNYYSELGNSPGEIAEYLSDANRAAELQRAQRTAPNAQATSTAPARPREGGATNRSPSERYVNDTLIDENMSDSEKAERITSTGYYEEAFEHMYGVDLTGTNAEKKRAVREWLQNRAGAQEDSEGADVLPNSDNASTDESDELNRATATAKPESPATKPVEERRTQPIEERVPQPTEERRTQPAEEKSEFSFSDDAVTKPTGFGTDRSAIDDEWEALARTDTRSPLIRALDKISKNVFEGEYGSEKYIRGVKRAYKKAQRKYGKKYLPDLPDSKWRAMDQLLFYAQRGITPDPDIDFDDDEELKELLSSGRQEARDETAESGTPDFYTPEQIERMRARERERAENSRRNREPPKPRKATEEEMQQIRNAGRANPDAVTVAAPEQRGNYDITREYRYSDTKYDTTTGERETVRHSRAYNDAVDKAIDDILEITEDPNYSPDAEPSEEERTGDRDYDRFIKNIRDAERPSLYRVINQIAHGEDAYADLTAQERADLLNYLSHALNPETGYTMPYLLGGGNWYVQWSPSTGTEEVVQAKDNLSGFWYDEVLDYYGEDYQRTFERSEDADYSYVRERKLPTQAEERRAHEAGNTGRETVPEHTQRAKDINNESTPLATEVRTLTKEEADTEQTMREARRKAERAKNREKGKDRGSYFSWLQRKYGISKEEARAQELEVERKKKAERLAKLKPEGYIIHRLLGEPNTKIKNPDYVKLQKDPAALKELVDGTGKWESWSARARFDMLERLFPEANWHLEHGAPGYERGDGADLGVNYTVKRTKEGRIALDKDGKPITEKAERHGGKFTATPDTITLLRTTKPGDISNWPANFSSEAIPDIDAIASKENLRNLNRNNPLLHKTASNGRINATNQKGANTNAKTETKPRSAGAESQTGKNQAGAPGGGHGVSERAAVRVTPEETTVRISQFYGEGAYAVEPSSTEDDEVLHTASFSDYSAKTNLVEAPAGSTRTNGTTTLSKDGRIHVELRKNHRAGKIGRYCAAAHEGTHVGFFKKYGRKAYDVADEMYETFAAGLSEDLSSYADSIRAWLKEFVLEKKISLEFFGYLAGGDVLVDESDYAAADELQKLARKFLTDVGAVREGQYYRIGSVSAYNDAYWGSSQSLPQASATSSEETSQSSGGNKRVTKKAARDMARAKYEEDLFRQQELRNEKRGVTVVGREEDYRGKHQTTEPQSAAEYAAMQNEAGEDGKSNADMAKQERAITEEEYRQQRYADTRGVDNAAGWSQQERARREEQREAEKTVEATENHFAATQAYGEEVHRNIIKTANRVANMAFLPDPSGKPVRNRNARHMQPLIDAVVGLADGSLTLNDFINTYHEFGEAENKDTVGYFYDPAVDARLRRLKEFPMDGEGQYSTEARSILKETMDMLEHRTQRLLNKRADASKAVTEIKSTNTGLDGKTPALFKGFMLKQLRPDTFFRAITGFVKNTSNVANQLAGKAEKSTQRKINISTVAENYFIGAMENVKAYRDFSTGKTKVNTVIPGLDRSMSMNEALGLLRTLETDGAKEHIIKCAEREADDDGYGTVFSHSEEDLYGGNQENGFRNPLRASLLSDEAIKALQDAWSVDPNQRGRAISQARAKARLELDALAKSLRAEVEADAVASKFDKAITRAMRMLGKEIDSTYSAMYGVNAAKQGKNYWPLSVASTGNDAELMADIRSGLKNAKFIQERVGPSGSLRIMTATDVMSHYIDAASDFAAFAELSDDLELMSKTYRGDTSFKAQLEKSFGREAGKWLDRYVDTLNGKRGDTSRWASKIRSNLAQSSLLLNGGVALKQSPSYFDIVGAGVDFDIAMQAWRPFRSAKSWSDNPLVNAIATRSSMLEARKRGYADVEIGEFTKSARDLSKKLVDRIPAVLTNWITKTDFRTVSNVLLACQMQVEKNGGVEVGSAEYYDRIARLFEDVVLKTQPIYTAQFRAEYQRSDNELIRSLSMFRSQQTQNLNQIINAVGEYNQIKKGGDSEAIRKAEQNMHRVFAGQITGSVLFGILSGVARGLLRKDDDFKDKDGNITAGSVLKRLGLNTVESMAGTVWFGDVAAKALVDVVSNAVTGGKGTKEFYSVNDNVISGFNSLITNLISFASKPSAKKGWNIAFSLSQLTGLPIRNCYNMVNAVVKDFQSVDERFNFTVDDSSENAPAEPDKSAPSTALANAATATKPSSTSSAKKADTDLDKQIRIAKKEASEYDTSRDNAAMDKILAAKLGDDDTDSYVDKYMSKPYREVYFTLRDAGFEPKEIYNRYKDIDTENGGNGNISQKEMLAYYKAHPEASALIAAIYNSKGYTKYPTWDEYIKHKK